MLQNKKNYILTCDSQFESHVIGLNIYLNSEILTFISYILQLLDLPVFLFIVIL
jgi:hypothetical protein